MRITVLEVSFLLLPGPFPLDETGPSARSRYVGALPGLAALNGLGDNAGPAIVLGLDVLKRRPRMLYTPTAVYL